MGKKTVMKYVKSFEDKCLIATEHTTVILKSGQKRNGNLRYTIRPIKVVRNLNSVLADKLGADCGVDCVGNVIDGNSLLNSSSKKICYENIKKAIGD